MAEKRMSKKYTFKVYPQGRSREIYRVIEISGSKTLDDLCVAIINAYDFIHEHLYEFCMDNKPYSDNCYQSLTDDDRTETNIKIDKLKLQKGQNFLLLYDYGDDWMFTIHVQKVEEGKEAVETKVIGEKGKLVQYPDWDDEFDDEYEDEYDPEYDELDDEDVIDSFSDDGDFEEAFDKFDFDDSNVVLTPLKEEMYDLALRYKKAALWKQLWDNQVFAVKLRNDEIGYVCVMGRGGSFCGMNLYVGVNSYDNYRMLQNSPKPGASYFQAREHMFSQNCLQLSFASKEELHPLENSELKIYSNINGTNFRGYDAYPQFVKYAKNCYPWMVQDELELKYLRDAIFAVTLLAEELNQHAKMEKKKKNVMPGQYELDFGENTLKEVEKYEFEIPEVKEASWEVPCFEVKETGIAFAGMVKLPEEKPVEYQKPVFENEVLITALKKKPHVGIWDAELIRLTEPVQENPEDPKDVPIFPAMIMMVSRKNGYLLPAMMSAARDDDFTELLQNLAEAWQKEERIPRKIFTRDDRTKSFLEDLCSKLGIAVSVSEELPFLDEAQDAFLQEFGDGALGFDENGEINDEQLVDELENMVDFILAMDPRDLKRMPKGMIADFKRVAALGCLPADKEAALIKKLSKL